MNRTEVKVAHGVLLREKLIQIRFECDFDQKSIQPAFIVLQPSLKGVMTAIEHNVMYCHQDLNAVPYAEFVAVLETRNCFIDGEKHWFFIQRIITPCYETRTSSRMSKLT